MAARENDLSIDFLEADEPDVLDVDRDGVASLHDVESEAGDEAELRDRFLVDRTEARQLGVDLDPIGGEESRLD
jgi:hypothetical protein